MPAVPVSNPYSYFMYSTSYIDKRNEVEGNMGRRFECGNIVVNGKRKKFAYIAKNTSSRDSFIKNYPDARIITEGYLNKMVYDDCSTTMKRSN